MFGSSTHFKHWTFKNESELKSLRTAANQDYITKYKENKELEDMNQFLTVEEEQLYVKFYELSLKDFCRKFQVPSDSRLKVIKMPDYVICTAQHYFKRFFYLNSVMDYHPKEILVTCVYLACKIEEFYVTISDFVSNIKGDKKRAAEIILKNELQLMRELQFHLIVYQPYRPVEGLLIDIKTRFPDLPDPERLRPYINEFLEKVHFTDAVLLYSPSQIALAAVTTAVSKLRENLDSYVTDILFKDHPKELAILIEAVRKIKRIVKTFDATVDEDVIQKIEERLERCRNQYNNPNSALYNTLDCDYDDDDMALAPSEPLSKIDDTLGIVKL